MPWAFQVFALNKSNLWESLSLKVVSIKGAVQKNFSSDENTYLWKTQSKNTIKKYENTYLWTTHYECNPVEACRQELQGWRQKHDWNIIT